MSFEKTIVNKLDQIYSSLTNRFKYINAKISRINYVINKLDRSIKTL